MRSRSNSRSGAEILTISRSATPVTLVSRRSAAASTSSTRNNSISAGLSSVHLDSSDDDSTDPLPSSRPRGLVKTVLSIADEEHAPEGTISVADIRTWNKELRKDTMFQLASTILSRTSMGIVLASRQIIADDQMVFSNKVDMAGDVIANQKSSGRCWLFATTNVLRIFVARKYKLESFQLSQSYLYFMDHVSKANWFLEQMIDLIEEPLDSRTVQYLLASSEAQDGGQYDMAVALIEAYGLVPQSIYPESFNTSNSDQLDTFLSSKLREHAVEIRQHYAELLKTTTAKQARRKARELKNEQMKEIYRVLCFCCGTPPQPREDFIWEFYDKDNKYNRLITNPIDFAQHHTNYAVSDTISIINDPRNPFHKLYTVERLGNVVGGRPIRYLNLPVEELKHIAATLLEANIPVWFGCDVGKASSSGEGVMDTSLYNYNDAFGTTVHLTKAERLETGDSSMTHAMTFVGVHIDPVTHKTVRWKVENSWGPDACNKGFFVMSDEWFTENVFQIVSPRHYVPEDLVHLYDTGKVTSLPPWDPMGALA